MRRIPVETPHGTAVAHVEAVEDPRGVLVLGHGAGGSVTAPDLTAAAGAARDAGFTVVLVEQPYRVEGRRAPPRAPVLDAAWTMVLAALTRTAAAGGSLLVVGGRSSGARVACRTAAATGADGVLCLAFPLRPARREGRPEPATRLPELDQVSVPVLVVQGARDPFGVPPSAPGRTVRVVTGDHALRADLDAVRDAVRTWLLDLAAREAAVRT